MSKYRQSVYFNRFRTMNEGASLAVQEHGMGQADIWPLKRVQYLQPDAATPLPG